METTSKYCKAYLVADLSRFPEWSEKATSGRNPEEPHSPQKPGDKTFLYLHDDFVVTDGIFRHENIVFDDVNPPWIEYCQSVLHFDPASVLES
jgi:hypothetical protein